MNHEAEQTMQDAQHLDKQDKEALLAMLEDELSEPTEAEQPKR